MAKRVALSRLARAPGLAFAVRNLARQFLRSAQEMYLYLTSLYQIAYIFKNQLTFEEFKEHLVVSFGVE